MSILKKPRLEKVREKIKNKKRIVSKLLMLLLVADLLGPMASTPMLVNAATPRMIYEYSGANQKTSGYAQGTITLSNVENVVPSTMERERIHKDIM